MISRPQPAHWFQMLVARDDLPRALSLFAGRQGVEPQMLDSAAYPTLSPELGRLLERFQELAQRYRAHWPKIVPEPSGMEEGNPLTVLDRALEALEAWRLDADPLVQRLQEERGYRAELALYIELATHLGDSTLDLARLGQGGGTWLDTGLFVLSLETDPLAERPGVLLRTVVGDRHRFYIATGSKTSLNDFSAAVTNAQGRAMIFPHWLPGTPRQVLPDLHYRLERCQEKVGRLRQALEEVGLRHRIPGHLQAAARLQWFFSAMRRVDGNPRFALVAGWTDGGDQRALNGMMNRHGARALVALDGARPAGVGDDPPLILNNPWWAKPFELFPGLLGTPGASEADPSRLLFFIAPLLFGYMFGDVGQGLVLAGVGWMLRKRLQAAWLLIFGGITATLFGFLFGSLFCIETLIPPLWLHPAQHPLEVLAMPLVLGVLMITVGLGLEGVGRLWSGEWQRWLRRDAGVVVLYLGVVMAVFHPLGWWVAASGLFLYLLGNWLAAAGPVAFLGRLGHLLETTMQLAVNSLSFARVGAFALAHAGLSQAVVTLAGLTGGTVSAALILLFGNLLILALEGLVVSVQTTRLILFEFFVRFLRGTGRPFRPLPPPPTRWG